MQSRVSHISIRGLFGHLDHDINFRDQITILTGPNGTGKTHVLSLLRDFVALDMQSAAEEPFESLTLTYQDKRRLTATRVQDDDQTDLVINGTTGKKRLNDSPFRVSVRKDALDGVSLPSYIIQTGEDEWVDERDGEILDMGDLYSRFPSRPRRESQELPGIPEWLSHFAPTARPTFIATGRLDLSPLNPMVRRRLPVAAPKPGAAARINQYVAHIQRLVNQARRESLQISQERDRGFAARALDKARVSVNEVELRDRYEAMARLNRELHTNGLTAKSMGVAFPQGTTTDTERRILNVFIDDWQRKLQPLVPVNDKLQTLRSIVGEKLSNKRLTMDGGQLSAEDPDGNAIPVDMLSSGEQHLIALFTMLLFDAQRGSLVLIDEPEISLHAAWKDAFLDDITRVAEVNDFQVVLATHSTSILRGRWDLTEELGIDG